MDWTPAYLLEQEGAIVSVAAYKAIAFPAAGIAEALFAGQVYTRFYLGGNVPFAFSNFSYTFCKDFLCKLLVC